MAADASAAAPAPWRDRRFPVLLGLGFSAGVPLPLVAGLVLRQWFSEAGVSLAEIGLTALIGLSYSLKFLWSPALDALPPPLFRGLGRRRGWLLTIQPLLALGILATGLTDPAADPARTAALAALVAFLSASQDVVVDAWRIESLAEREQGIGLAFYIWGYRGALLASGAGTLWTVGALGWSGAYAYAACLVLVGVAAALLAPEPAPPAPREASVLQRPIAGSDFVRKHWWWLRVVLFVMSPPLFLLFALFRRVYARRLVDTRIDRALFQPLLDFLRRPYWLAILLFVALFKLGEALAGVMTAPFYRSLGFSREAVAGVGSVFGLFATLGGAMAGGWLVARIGTARALVLTGLGQMLSNLMYVALAEAGHSLPMLWAQVGVESFTDGLADAAFITYLSALTSRAVSATHYALLSSLAGVPLRLLGAGSGVLAEALGWPGFFLLTTAAALPAMGLMLWLLGRLPPPSEEARAAPA